MTEARFVPWTTYVEYPPDEMLRRAREFNAELQRRRTIRAFSPRPVARAVIEQCILAAGSAPSGAHLQPWHFVAVSDPKVKADIRTRAEAAEREFYHGVAPREWLEVLAPLGTDEHKPYLESAPWLIAAFAKLWGTGPDGGKRKHYYVQESVGIACGLLIAALHHAGLATLTHTPSPMGFLAERLGRPENERAVMLVVAGHPADGVQVPDIRRKRLGEIAEFVEP
jgi:iodotyrosine deiodinase